jgi:TetR/AcrR family transcriptional repressor of lmrAB and yxaGH operons
MREHQKAGMEAWIEAIAVMLHETGLPARIARERAEDAVIRIQGGLVMARAKDDVVPFQRTLKSLPQDLLRKPE